MITPAARLVRARLLKVRASTEAGLTLVELIVASGISLLVLSVVLGLFISTSHAQNSIRTATQAADLGQLIARSVEQGVANATGLKVQTDTTTGAQLMVARTYGGNSSVDPTQGAASGTSCQAWFYSPNSGGAIYTKRTTPATAITMPSGAPDSTWTLIGEGLEVQVGAAPSATIFSTPDGNRVDLKFDVINGEGHPVHIETTATIPNLATVSAPCF